MSMSTKEQQEAELRALRDPTYPPTRLTPEREAEIREAVLQTDVRPVTPNALPAPECDRCGGRGC